jgi:two-component system, LytTR family, sensor kinase
VSAGRIARTSESSTATRPHPAREAAEGWSEETTIVVGAAVFAVWFSLSEMLAWGVSLRPLLLRSLLQWMGSAVLCVPVFRLIRRYPIARPHRVTRALLYVLLGIPVEIVHHLLAIRTATLYVLGQPSPSLRYMLLSALTVDQLTYASCVAVMHVLLFRRRTQESAIRVARLEAELAEARLSALRERLQPDLVYAALREIRDALHTSAMKARRLLSRLGEFLRDAQRPRDEAEGPFPPAPRAPSRPSPTAARPARRASVAWPLAILWVGVTGWRTLSAYVLFRDEISLANVSGMLLDMLVWGVLGVPVVALVVRRHPLNLPRALAYAVLGIALSVPCRSLSWAAEQGDRDLGTWLSDVGGLWNFWSLVALAHLVLYARRHEIGRLRETALRGQIAAARLRVLEMQLRPHFLLNALNSVASLVGRDPAAAARMLARIEDFLRLSLSSSASAAVSLQDEMSFLEHYLSIQRVRFQDRLTTEFHVEPRAGEAVVPTFILQPIVENAIRHGIAPRSARGHIAVRAECRGRRLHLTVHDDGVGTSLPMHSGRFGLGLSNTAARLQLLYGGDHHLMVTSDAGGGFTVTMDLPWQPATSGP